MSPGRYLWQAKSNAAQDVDTDDKDKGDEDKGEGEDEDKGENEDVEDKEADDDDEEMEDEWKELEDLEKEVMSKASSWSFLMSNIYPVLFTEWSCQQSQYYSLWYDKDFRKCSCKQT